MRRRAFLLATGGLLAAGLAVTARRYWPDDGFFNPCLEEGLPEGLGGHELVAAAWEGVRPARLWDCHVHLLGTSRSGNGVWINPRLDSPWHPVQWVQKRFYLNAGCVDDTVGGDAAYVGRLLQLIEAFPTGARLMLLAFDYHYGPDGRRRLEHSSFYVPNRYAAVVARGRSDRLAWICSVHPYREDALEALERAAADGARAVKWLPPAQGMDPADRRCNAFYDTMRRLGLVLLSHTGTELAVQGSRYQELGNPLRLRRPLERGVVVIAAHCGSLGTGEDLDRRSRRPVANFELFSRLMDEPAWQGRLYGGISALPQINRAGEPLRVLLRRRDWHPRVVNGSDYPLPGIFPLFNLRRLVADGLLAANEVEVLLGLRRYNPLLFDFVLKRRLRSEGRGFAPLVFESKRAFETGPNEQRLGKARP